jgi:hypothetical protein
LINIYLQTLVDLKSNLFKAFLLLSLSTPSTLPSLLPAYSLARQSPKSKTTASPVSALYNQTADGSLSIQIFVLSVLAAKPSCSIFVSIDQSRHTKQCAATIADNNDQHID